MTSEEQKQEAREEFFARAFYFAMKAHESQFRKGTGRPYIEHPIRVAALLMEMQVKDHVVAAGFLHDVVEDTQKGLSDIEQLFGKKTSMLVRQVTEDKSRPWEERKKSTIAYLRDSSYEVVLLSLADKLDNLRSIRQDYEKNGEQIWQRFSRPKIDQKWYYTSVCRVMKDRMKGKKEVQFYLEFEALVSGLFPKVRAGHAGK